MRKKEVDGIAGLFGMAFLGLFYNLYLTIDDFYTKNPVLFYLTIFLALVCIVGIWIFLRILHNRKWLAIEKIEDMQKLHWREFEEFIVFVLRKRGFNAKLGKGTRDGGVDIEATFEGRKYLIQCKKWNKFKVTEPNIREFLGAISDFDIDAKGIYITTSHLTSDARAFAKRNDITIWDKSSLEKYVSLFTGKSEVSKFEEVAPESVGDAAVQRPHQTICSRCGGKLLKRVAKYGDNKGNTFLGCENFPRCKEIVNI